MQVTVPHESPAQVSSEEGQVLWGQSRTRLIKSHVIRQWTRFTGGKSFPKTLLSGPIPALAALAARISAVSVAIVTKWNFGGLWGLHPGPWALRMSEGSRWLLGLPVRQSEEWEVLLAKVGAQAEEVSLLRQECGGSVPSAWQ